MNAENQLTGRGSMHGTLKLIGPRGVAEKSLNAPAHFARCGSGRYAGELYNPMPEFRSTDAEILGNVKQNLGT
jgi:hypothetical protein